MADTKYTAALYVSQDVMDALYSLKHASDNDLNDTLGRLLKIKKLPSGITRHLDISPRTQTRLIESGNIDARSIAFAVMHNSVDGLGLKGRAETLRAVIDKYPDDIPEGTTDVLDELELRLARKQSGE